MFEYGNNENSIVELNFDEINNISGGCETVYDCSVEAGKWVANKIEDGIDAIRGWLS